MNRKGLIPIVVLLVVAVVLVIGVVGYYYLHSNLNTQSISSLLTSIVSPTKPCSVPLEYRVGTLDPRFGVTQDAFLKDIAQAGDIWSNAIGKKLFEYNPNGSLVINLIYDNRQQATQETNTLHANIHQTHQVAASGKQQYTALQNDYTTAQQEYTNELNQFNEAEAAYNDSVNYWNGKGGAPPAEYATLNAEKIALVDQQNALEQKRSQVNQLADEINALIDKYNLLVNHINLDVNTINNNGIAGTQFEEGVYISDSAGTRINIYQFNSQAYFIRVLAHEMGHALQLQHNNNPDSIMNPINQSRSLVLSPEDLQELKTECGL